MKEVIVKLTSDRIKVKGGEYVRDYQHGEWKPFDLTWGRSVWYCTACEEGVEVPCDIWTHKPIYNFCPNCGADMREVRDE